jgi:hypothetical protein
MPIICAVEKPCELPLTLELPQPCAVGLALGVQLPLPWELESRLGLAWLALR